jgi:hypothetical protein
VSYEAKNPLEITFNPSWLLRRSTVANQE